jgi:hypothetical protein
MRECGWPRGGPQPSPGALSRIYDQSSVAASLGLWVIHVDLVMSAFWGAIADMLTLDGWQLAKRSPRWSRGSVLPYGIPLWSARGDWGRCWASCRSDYHRRAPDATTTLVLQLYRAQNLTLATMDAPGRLLSAGRRCQPGGRFPDHCYWIPPEQIAARVAFRRLPKFLRRI